MSNEGFYKAMATKSDGVFSIGLRCLQLQLKNLLEGVGGDHAAALLDAVATLGTKEQRLVLDVFTAVVQRIASSQEAEKMMTGDDAALKDLEDSLFKEIVQAFESEKFDGNAAGVVKTKTSLSLVNGRKEEKGVPLDFAKAFKARRPKNSVLN